MTRSVGLALSGGGVKGLAHIALLKALDELGVAPNYIAGTSMGAIVGALYACGLSGEEIESRVRAHIIPKGSKAKQIFKNRHNLIKWSKIFSIEKQAGGFIAADGLFEHLFHEIASREFTDLKIPFCAVATDFYSGKEVAITSGSVLSAIKASMAVPGVFAPVTRQGKTLVDGGLINNLPVNHIQDYDIKIASDVISLPRENTTNVRAPGLKYVLSGSLSIMLHNATANSLKAYPCTHLHSVKTDDIDTFDFLKIEDCLIRGEKAVDETRLKLEQIFSTCK